MTAGLDADLHEHSVYGYLVRRAPVTSEEVRSAVGLQPAQALAALARLEEMGFAYRLAGNPVRFVAASPALADAAIGGQIADLQQSGELPGQVSAQAGCGVFPAAPAGDFELVQGAAALRGCVLDMLTAARSEIVNMVRPPVVAVHVAEHARANLQSVRERTIFDQAMVGETGTLQALGQGLSGYEEIRIHSRVPMKLLAVDRKMALLPLDQADASVGLLIGRSVILDSVLALFDYVWDTSVRLDVVDGAAGPAAGRSSPLTEADRRLLSLLLAGLTDEAIAVHLGVSVRTIERRARALMDTAHVRSRIQLAWEAARQKWL